MEYVFVQERVDFDVEILTTRACPPPPNVGQHHVIADLHVEVHPLLHGVPPTTKAFLPPGLPEYVDFTHVQGLHMEYVDPFLINPSSQGSHMEYVFVQEWVDFDVEIRNYVVLPDVSDPKTCLPRGQVCTMFQEETAHGGFTNFSR